MVLVTDGQASAPALTPDSLNALAHLLGASQHPQHDQAHHDTHGFEAASGGAVAHLSMVGTQQGSFHGQALHEGRGSWLVELHHRLQSRNTFFSIPHPAWLHGPGVGMRVPPVRP